ncbi:MAG TPA: energy-coupling factor transporter transmembrane component T [Clostridia bacterium]|nr:energy-coupling factor transporter transmembrane component T [Clostridia bacterium]
MVSGTYLPGNSFVHKADPRMKFSLLILWVIALILPVSIAALAAYYLALVLLIWAGLSLGQVFQPLKTIWPLLLMIALLTPPFHQSGRELYQVGGFILITKGGLQEAIILIVRFSGITSAFFLFFRTTTIDDFILTLRWFGLPYSGALVVTIAFRYIPSLLQLYRNIEDAHALRRPVPEGRRKFHPIKKFSHIFPTLVSVMIHSIKGIPTLSMALESRGFGRHNPRTSYRSLLPLKEIVHQAVLFIIVLLFLVLLLFM